MDNVLTTAQTTAIERAAQSLQLQSYLPTIQTQLDKAAGNSLDSRNMIIRRILEQYFNGELSRADLTPLDYGHSINFDVPAVRREVPNVYPQEKLKYSE